MEIIMGIIGAVILINLIIIGMVLTFLVIYLPIAWLYFTIKRKLVE